MISRTSGGLPAAAPLGCKYNMDQENQSDRILSLLREAQSLAEKSLGIGNILQPGIIKELIMASVLGHQLIPRKDMPDARDSDGNTYEYLASINRIEVTTNKGCSFQIDRVTKNNLTRITRNKAFYFGIFKTHLELDEIWRIDTDAILQEVNRQLSRCKNEIAHVNFLSKWVKETGERVYPDASQQVAPAAAPSPRR